MKIVQMVIGIAATLLAVWFVPAQDAAKIETGKWEGEFVGVNGMKGKVSVEMNVDGEKVSGTYSIEFANEDSPYVVSGKFEGAQKDGKVSFKVKPEKSKDTLDCEGVLTSADPYAKQSIYGTVKDSSKFNNSGVWIIWKFAK